jgi:hypothetical protein
MRCIKFEWILWLQEWLEIVTDSHLYIPVAILSLNWSKVPRQFSGTL